jgi:hypothetical protein
MQKSKLNIINFILNNWEILHIAPKKKLTHKYKTGRQDGVAMYMKNSGIY